MLGAVAFWQTDVVPLIVAVGNGLTVVVVPALVPMHPLPSVSVTVYVLAVVAVILDVVAPPGVQR